MLACSRSTLPVLALNLLDSMLTLDPSKRITAEAAMNSEWLKSTSSVPPVYVTLRSSSFPCPA